MPLTPNEASWLKEYESLPDAELALLSEYSGHGIDSKNRAALARYELARRSSAIRDGREERTLAISERALTVAEEANRIASEAKNATAAQARWAMWAVMIAIVSAIVSVVVFLSAAPK